MTPLDFCLLALLLVSVLQGLRRGLLLTLTAILGLAAGTLAACWYAPRLAAWLQPRFQGWSHGSIQSFAAIEIFSFLAIAFTVMLIAHLFGRALRGGVRTIGLGWADRIFGGIFGLARGVVFLGIVFMVLSLFFPGSLWVRSSRLAPYGLYAARTMTAAMPPDVAQQTLRGARRLGGQVQQLY